MDDGLLRRLSEVIEIQGQLRERYSAIIVPQLLTNMLLLDILYELKELNKVKYSEPTTQLEAMVEGLKKGSKITPLRRAVTGGNNKGNKAKKSK